MCPAIAIYAVGATAILILLGDEGLDITRLQCKIAMSVIATGSVKSSVRAVRRSGR